MKLSDIVNLLEDLEVGSTDVELVDVSNDTLHLIISGEIGIHLYLWTDGTITYMIYEDVADESEGEVPNTLYNRVMAIIKDWSAVPSGPQSILPSGPLF